MSESTKEIMQFIETANQNDISELLAFLKSKPDCTQLARLISINFGFCENE